MEVVRRSATSPATDKKIKDLRQARFLVELLKEDRPGDLALALETLTKRGKTWINKVEAACKEGVISL